MIRSGLRQHQRGPASVCLLCCHRLLLLSPPRLYSSTSNRLALPFSATPNSSALHATPSRASNQFAWGAKPAPDHGRSPGPGAAGGWGAGNAWGAGGGLQRDPELEARKARDREAWEANQRAAQEARQREARAYQEAQEAKRREAREQWEAQEAKRREVRERGGGGRRKSEAWAARHQPEAFGAKRADLLRNQPSGTETRRGLPFGGQSLRSTRERRDTEFGASRELRSPSRQPAGSDRLPWRGTSPQERTAQDNQRQKSSFWSEAEVRTNEAPAPDPQFQIRRLGTDPPAWKADRGPRYVPTSADSRPSAARSARVPESLDLPDKSKESDLAMLDLFSSKLEIKPAVPQQQKSEDMDSIWDWADAHLNTPKTKKPARELSEALESGGGGYGAQPESQVRGEPRTWEQPPQRWQERPARTQKPRRRESSRDDEEDFDVDGAKERRRRKAERKAEKERARLAALEEAGPTPILLPEFISVSNLAVALGVKPNVFLDQMMELGFDDISIDNILTGETAAIIAEEYGFNPTVETGEGQDLKPAPAPEDPSSLPDRPPVVTIMGHVDHGKTTLLDFLRKSSVAAGEHGGITQHIGAFSVKMASGKQITFLDTPGHAAFVAMRQRGANVTDIAILVVAADDSVKPQTIEALKHARAAKVPMIVAITKVDKPDANVERVKSDLAAQGIEIEDYGGDVQVVPVSGKTGQGMDDLEENILLLSEILDIRAEKDGMAEGWVLESSIKPTGRAATILVKRGTLRCGDFIVAGTVSTRIRSLRNEAGVEVDEAPPGTAIEVLGWKDPPNAGDQVLQAPDKDKADGAVKYRLEQKEREEVIAQNAQQEQERREREREKAAAEAAESAGRDHVPEETEESGAKIVNFTVKGDVHGSVEAVCSSVQEIGSNEVRPRILMSSAGQITESDVEHAAVSGSCIINFNNPVAGHIKRMAMNSKVRILDHNIIYHMAEEVKDVLSELLPPTITSKVVGEAEILQVFAINIKGRVFKNVAGCRIRNGHMTIKSTCRVMRNGEEVFTGPVVALKQGKKDATEVKKGVECGVSFKDWEDFKQGDQIQVLEEVVEKRRLK